ncbi:CPBP family intramembrane metalloprotease [bacterium]|nr:MAG: CPBP family intramembrane metalloprotease [bacterium]
MGKTNKLRQCGIGGKVSRVLMNRGYGIFPRILISLVAVILPAVLLFKGIYGSFIFTFSIPLIWKVGIRGERFDSLGLRLNSIKHSITIGMISGFVLGIAGGSGLEILGLTGLLFTSADKLQFSFSSLTIAFPLQQEVGYRLLSMSNALVGTCVFFVFCIIAVGLGEEIFWRGFIQKRISGFFPANIAIWITAIIFSVIHFYIFTIIPLKTGIAFLMLIALAGGVWGYLFKHFGNIWSAAISHGIAAFIIWKYYFFATN